jgi:hypothetical protein
MQIENIMARYNLVPLTFMQDAVAASQADAQLPVAEVASGAANGCDGYRMPWPGEIVGISAYLSTTSGAAAGGTLKVGATIDGTEKSDPTVTLSGVSEQSASDTCKRGTTPFAAGSIIGAEITTNATWGVTTADLVVQVWVTQEVQGI